MGCMAKYPLPTPKDYTALERRLCRRPIKGRVRAAVEWMRKQPVDWVRGTWVWTDVQGSLCSVFDLMFSDICERPKEYQEWADVRTWMTAGAPSWSKDTFNVWVLELHSSFEHPAHNLNDPTWLNWVEEVFRLVPQKRLKTVNQYHLGAVLTDALLVSHQGLIDVLLPHTKRVLSEVGSTSKVSLPNQSDSVHALVFCRSQSGVNSVLSQGLTWWDKAKSKHDSLDPWPALALWLSQQADEDDGSGDWTDWTHDRRQAVLYPNLRKAMAEPFWGEASQESVALVRFKELTLMCSETGDMAVLRTSHTERLSKAHAVSIANALAFFNPLRLGEWLDWFSIQERLELEKQVLTTLGYTLWDAVLASNCKGFHWGYDGWSGDKAALKDTLLKLTPQPMVEVKEVKQWIDRMMLVHRANKRKYVNTSEAQMRRPFGVFANFGHPMMPARIQQAKMVLYYANRDVRPIAWSQEVFSREVGFLEEGVIEWWSRASKAKIERFIESEYSPDADALYNIKSMVDARALLQKVVEPQLVLRVEPEEKGLSLQKHVTAAKNVMSIAEDMKVESAKRPSAHPALRSILELMLEPQPRAKLLDALLESIKAGDSSSVGVKALLTNPRWIKVWDNKGLLTESNYLFNIFGGRFNGLALKKSSGKLSLCTEAALAEMIKLEEWVALRNRVGTSLDETASEVGPEMDAL